uniref:Uncharacterized protein n=1 Tax=Oryza punctata TaxID=4537 RepID=A0A0E0K4L5_ORYPU
MKPDVHARILQYLHPETRPAAPRESARGAASPSRMAGPPEPDRERVVQFSDCSGSPASFSRLYGTPSVSATMPLRRTDAPTSGRATATAEHARFSSCNCQESFLYIKHRHVASKY